MSTLSANYLECMLCTNNSGVSVINACVHGLVDRVSECMNAAVFGPYRVSIWRNLLVLESTSANTLVGHCLELHRLIPLRSLHSICTLNGLTCSYNIIWRPIV